MNRAATHAVHGYPDGPVERVGGEIYAGIELVGKGKSQGNVRVKMYEIPRLVAHPAPHGPSRQ